MLAKWTEILPVFIFKWLAIKHCQRTTWNYGEHLRKFAIARPDVLIKIKGENN